MSLKEKFESINCITNPALENLILKYFGTYYTTPNKEPGLYFLATQFSVRIDEATTLCLDSLNNLFYNNKEITESMPNVYLYTVYKLIDKLDKAKVDCSDFDNSHFLNIIRLSKVAYDFAISTSKLHHPKSNYSILRGYHHCNRDKSISFKDYKNSADEIIKDVDVYHDMIVKWYKKNKKLPSTSTKFGYNLYIRMRDCDELWNKVEKILVELISTYDEKFLLVEKRNDYKYKKLYFLNGYPCKIISLPFRELYDGNSIYMYLLVEYIAMIDDVIDTSKFTDDEIIELVKEYNSIYESIMKPWLKDDFKLTFKLRELQKHSIGKEDELRVLMYPTMKVFFKAFLDSALSKMKK